VRGGAFLRYNFSSLESLGEAYLPIISARLGLLCSYSVGRGSYRKGPIMSFSEGLPESEKTRRPERFCRVAVPDRSPQ